MFYSKKTDLHAHTIWSDGLYTIEESIKNRSGIADVLGISDHYRAVLKLGFDKYIDEIKSLEFKNIKAGIEIFYIDLNKLSSKVKQEQFSKLDFIIVEDFERIIDQKNLLTNLVELKSSFHGDVILAHPDFKYLIDTYGRTYLFYFLSFCKEKHILIELNISDIYLLYEGLSFIEIMEINKEVYETLIEVCSYIIISTDCHGGEENILYKEFNEVYSYFVNDDWSLLTDTKEYNRVNLKWGEDNNG